MNIPSSQNHAVHAHLVEICEQIALGNYEKAKELFEFSSREQADEVNRLLAEALSMMLVRIEAREFERDRLLAAVSEAQEELERHRGRLAEENKRLRAKVREKEPSSRIVGNAPAMQALQVQAERLASSRATVLITGETGSGKGVLARRIHDIGPRAGKPFVDINCAAIPASLLESELFGIEAGVASGVQARMGRFEQADGGTLLLDEIGDMPLESQGKILHVLESGTVERIGGRKRIPVDVRLMAATHRDIEDLVKRSLFREDLFYRLHVVRLHIPPLRDRADDIPLLVSKILDELAAGSQSAPRRVSPDALNLLMRHTWPGNIRELRHVLERAQLFAEGVKITAAEVAASLHGHNAGQTLSPPWEGVPGGDARLLTLDEAMDRHIREALARNGGNKSLTARILGISREGLRMKLARVVEPSARGPQKRHGKMER
ncbi:sigma-54 dependent transcriptional regulator [Desulfovibrio sp. OttesenSCG-928-G15]|nr:sigma-54 dependent transcriptional regulator [Desulfovibrio sp. OttesenSCG-928-G15]